MRNIDAMQAWRLTRRMKEIRAQTAACLAALPTPAHPSQRELQALVAQLIAPYDAVGACVVLLHHGETIAILPQGMAVLPDVPVTRDTRFRAASISKMVGNLLAMQLVEEGTLALDEDISAYLGFYVGNPRYPYAKLTLRQLMTHTSGLHDHGDYAFIGTPKAIPLPDFFATAEKARGNFTKAQPGTRFGYANLGAGMIGAVIEAVTGKDFDENMQTRIFEPLGMDASYHPQRIRDKARMANIYRYPKHELSYDAAHIAASPLEDFASPQRHYFTMPGRLMIRAADLMRLMRVILGDGSVDGVRIVRAETTEAMRTLQRSISSVMGDAGRGLNIAIAENTFTPHAALWGHQGSAYGAITEAWGDPVTQNAVVFMTNGVRTTMCGPLAAVGHDVITAMMCVLETMDGLRA